MSSIVKSPQDSGSVKEWTQRMSRRSQNPVLYSTSVEVGNGAGTVDVLHSCTIPTVPGGYYWKGSEQTLRVTACGHVAANAGTKTIELHFDAGGAMFSRSSAMNGGNWKLVSEFTCNSVDEFFVWTSFQCDANLNPVYVDIQRGVYSNPGVRIGEGAVIELHGGSAAFADDVQCNLFRVEQFFSPNSY